MISSPVALRVVMIFGVAGCGSAEPTRPQKTDPGPTADSAVAPPSETGVTDTAPPVTYPPGPAVGGNIIFILSDDQGVDKIGVYGEHDEPPRTPVLDALAEDGVLFRRAYAHPICSPTRASVLTGRYGERYGLGEVINPQNTGFALRDVEVTIAEALATGGYHSEAFGKWHLAGFTSASGTLHPETNGFAWYAGSYGNLEDEKAGTNQGIDPTYYWWQKTTNGQLAHVLKFATTDSIDDALARIPDMPEPWFLYLPLNPPHTPLSLPPEHLHGYDEVQFDSPESLKVAALIESMDTEIGRLLTTMDPAVRARTTVIFMGDNGTKGEAMIAPWRSTHGKNTPYEGGIRVPLIINGPAVVDPGREVTALVHAVDIFPTIADLAGVDLSQVLGWDGQPIVIDGVSMMPYLQDPTTAPLRQYVYTGKFGPNGPPNPVSGGYNNDWDILLDERWKYIRGYGPPEFYDLANPNPDDGMEGQNLLTAPLSAEAQEAYDRLVAELDAIDATLVYETGP